jgi:hypothetical protein
MLATFGRLSKDSFDHKDEIGSLDSLTGAYRLLGDPSHGALVTMRAAGKVRDSQDDCPCPTSSDRSRSFPVSGLAIVRVIQPSGDRLELVWLHYGEKTAHMTGQSLSLLIESPLRLSFISSHGLNSQKMGGRRNVSSEYSAYVVNE